MQRQHIYSIDAYLMFSEAPAHMNADALACNMKKKMGGGLLVQIANAGFVRDFANVLFLTAKANYAPETTSSRQRSEFRDVK